jgi:CRISPR/Cas system-associated exonuclease Cas4 (RecB family)
MTKLEQKQKELIIFLEGNFDYDNYRPTRKEREYAITLRKEIAELETEEQKDDKPPISNRCKQCGYPIALGEEYCGECVCEDDCAVD